MTRRALIDITPPEEVEALKLQRLVMGTLEPMLMRKHFGTVRAVAAASQAIREVRAADEDSKVAERKASGGRKASYAPSLSNNLPETKPEPDDWTCFLPDIETARAICEAGYFPLSEYVEMYGPDGWRSTTMTAAERERRQRAYRADDGP